MDIDYQLLTIIIVMSIAGIGWILTILMWRKSKMMNEKLLLLESPNIIIGNYEMRRDLLGTKLGEIYGTFIVKVENSGDRSANYPMWKRIIRLKNKKKYDTDWRNVHRNKRYIEGKSIPYKIVDEIKVNVNDINIDFEDITFIIRYTDASGTEWRSKSVFWLERYKSILELKERTRAYLVPKRKKEIWKEVRL